MTVKSFWYLEDKRANLRGLDIPILIFKGQCDNQKWGYRKEYLDLFPNSELIILKEVGHDIISTRGEDYLLKIQDFLEKEM